MFCLYVCNIYHTPDAFGANKVALDALELELQILVNYSVGPGN